jgi:hypothetical protein
MMDVVRRVRWLVAAAIAVARLASAHEERASDVVPVLDPVPRRLAGVTIQLRHTLAYQLVVENRTGKVLEVLDERGAAFLRLGPAGAEANLTARDWYRTLSAGDVVVPARARADGAAAWTRVATAPAWGWYDRRLRPDEVEVPHRLRDAGVPATVGRWSVALRLGGVPVAVTGRFRFVPPARGAFRARIVSRPDPLPGVRVSLVTGRVPALYLENASDEPVIVLGSAGEPFLRIAPDGTSANVSSPTWLRSGKAPVMLQPVRADASSEPRWELQSASARYAWIEPRAAPLDTEAPRPGVVREWSVTLERGATRARSSSGFRWLRRDDRGEVCREASWSGVAAQSRRPARHQAVWRSITTAAASSRAGSPPRATPSTRRRARRRA